MITEIGSKPARPAGDVDVIVHASRTTTGLRVHEETRAVTTHPNGAVVRLRARVPAGDLVVLTHARTKVHVICRVRNVKPPADATDGVVLEFIQPSPSFWDEPADEKPEPSAPYPQLIAQSGARADARPDAPQPERIAARSDDASRAPRNQPAMPPVTPGMVDGAARPRERSVRTPVWRQRSEVRSPSLPLRSGPAAQSAAGLETGLAVQDARSERAAQMEAIEIARDALAADVVQPRASNTKVGAMVLVAVISIANGTLLGAWVYKQMAGGDAPPKQTTQHIGASPIEGPAAVSGEPVGPFGAASATAVSLRMTPGAPGVTARDVASGLLPQRARVDDQRAPREAASDAPSGVSSELTGAGSGSNYDATQILTDAPAAPSTFVGQIRAPRALRVLVVPAANDPLAMDDGRGLTQAGAAVRLLTDATASASPAPPAPPLGGRLVPARLISSPPPVYPAAARALRLQGAVTLDAVVDETGKVAQATVIEGNPMLQEAAQKALRNWKYEPARLNGSAISTHIKVSLQFGLK